MKSALQVGGEKPHQDQSDAGKQQNHEQEEARHMEQQASL
jgi:hypothetical protein